MQETIFENTYDQDYIANNDEIYDKKNVRLQIKQIKRQVDITVETETCMCYAHPLTQFV